MDNQKDNKIITQEQGILSDKIRPIYGFISKKTEKLITALYMVTDCIDFDDALKNKLRLLGVELLSNMHKFSTLPVIEKYNHVNVSISRISEIISFIDIALTIGFISEMNANILKNELNILISELRDSFPEKQQFSFVLDKEMFNTPRPIREFKRTDNMSFTNHYKRQDNMSFIKQNQPSQTKEERVTKIISLLAVANGEVSIKDISTTFTDCSEKTIQRELNDLVLKGKLKKTGAKRWSKYSLISGE